MLEIFAMVILWKTIRKLLQPINKNPLGYQIMMVVIWISFELIASTIAFIQFPSQHEPNTFSFNFIAYGFALIGAVIGGSFSYFFVKAIAEKKYPGLVVIATIYVIISFVRIFSIRAWSSESVFLAYGDLPTYHSIVTYIVDVLFLPFIAFGFITYNYRLGYVMGIVVTSILILNTIAMWLLSDAYGYSTSVITIIFPIIAVILLLTRYKNAFNSTTQLEIPKLEEPITNDIVLK